MEEAGEEMVAKTEEEAGEENAAKMEEEEAEAEIARALRARVPDFKQQADSLTFEGVRRALEKDLGMKAFSLDAHKRFIKKCLQEFYYGAVDENVPKSSEERGVEESSASQPMKEETQPDEHHSQEDRSNSSEFEERQPAENEAEGNESLESTIDLSEDVVKQAMTKRAAYFTANAQDISFAGVRRLLEKDLRVEMYSLDAYKSLVRKELDGLFNSPEFAEGTKGVKKKSPKKTSQKADIEKPSKSSKKASKDLDSSNSDDNLSEDEEMDEEIKGSKKRSARKSKASTERPKKMKKVNQESKSSSSRKKKTVEPEKSTVSDGGNSSDDARSHSSNEEGLKKKKEKLTQTYSKQVEHLKSVIKSCGMSIPPAVYKRVKQAPERKRETHLIKELEEILDREGLSTNPSEKEIKAVKKQKERAKELEGIDMNNIVSTSRRRTTTSFLPPPKPKVEVKNENNGEDNEHEEDEEDEEDDENEEDSDDGNVDDGDATEGSDEDAEDGSE